MNTTRSKKSLVAAAIVGIAFGTAVVYVNLIPVFAQDNATKAEADARIVELQKQKMAVLEKALKEREQRRRNGTGSKSDVIAAKIAMAEVQIDIAVLQDRRDTIIEQLNRILRLQEDLLDLVSAEFKGGIRNLDDILEQELAVIDARIRIAQVEANDV